MPILWLLLFIGVIQCDENTSTNEIPPSIFDNLRVPCPVEYLSTYSLTIQSAYLISMESMRTSGYYMNIKCNELNISVASTSNTPAYDDTAEGLTKMKNSFEIDQEVELEEKRNALFRMTSNYYINEKTGQDDIKPIDKVDDINNAQALLYAKQSESEFKLSINNILLLKSKYASLVNDVNSKSTQEWASISKSYYEVKQEIANDSRLFVALRNTFLLGNKINTCKEASETDKTLLDIYDCKSLSSFFKTNNNDAMELINKTVSHMYSVVKVVLANIYIKSVCPVNELEKVVRTTEWEQVNLVRVNYEEMIERIISYVKCIYQNAEINLEKNSDGFKNVSSQLYNHVEELLLLAVKFTKISYLQGWAFQMDGSMYTNSQTNEVTIDIMNNYYDKMLSRTNKGSRYDVRVIKNEGPYPTNSLCIPKYMYSLTVNTLFMQSVIIQVNSVLLQISVILNNDSDKSFLVYKLLMIIKMEIIVAFVNCLATTNKISSLNLATYVHMVLNTNESNKNTDTTLVMKYIDSKTIEQLSVYTSFISNTFDGVYLFVSDNRKEEITPTNYVPKKPESTYNKDKNTIKSNNNSDDNNDKLKKPEEIDGKKNDQVLGNVEITNVLENYNISVSTQFSTRITEMQHLNHTNCVQLAIISLEYSKQQFEDSYKYLYSLALETKQFIQDNMQTNSEAYYNALEYMYSDLQEKLDKLTSMIKVSIDKTTDKLLNSDNYMYVKQAITYDNFVNKLLSLFNFSYTSQMSDKNPNSYICYIINTFNQIYNDLMKRMKPKCNDVYKKYVEMIITKTYTALKQIFNSFNSQISASEEMLRNLGEESKIAFFNEIVFRVECLSSIFLFPFVKCNQYIQNSDTNTFFVSELEIIVYQYNFTAEYNTTVTENNSTYSFNYQQTITKQTKQVG